MNGLLIANRDPVAREWIAGQFNADSYQVTSTDSVVNALEGILDKSIQVVVLSGRIDEQHVAKFLPLLKKCNRNLAIILVSEEMPLELVRRIRCEGIFYHALQPGADEGWEEIRQVVDCAFETYHAQQTIGRGKPQSAGAPSGARLLLNSLLLLAAPGPHL